MSALGAAAWLLYAGAAVSCSQNEIAPDDTAGGGGNTLIYGEDRKSISSVIYTVDEDRVYTFYFSPTQGITTVNSMLLADNYIKVVTKTPTGDIDLLSAGNSLLYKQDINVSSETSDQVSKCSLSLKLNSVTTVTMSLDVAMSGTSSLTANYTGTCINATPSDDGTIHLDKQIFFYYYGPSTKVSNVNDYYLSVTNLPSWTGTGTSFQPTSEGYILTLDFYGEATEWNKFPEGTFTESDSNEDHTYYSASTYSSVAYCAPDGTVTDLQFTGEPVTIEYAGSGIYTVTATFIDMDDNDRTIVYTGELNISDGTKVQDHDLALLGKDVYFDGVPTADDPGGYAEAIYLGDVYESGSGLMNIYLYDKKGSNKQEGGYGMSLMIFTKTFNENPEIEEGKYRLESSFERWTALPGVEGYLLGGIIPWGTYVATVDDKSESGYYSFASEGEIIISKTEDQIYYHIEFDLTSDDGHKITGAFQGEIPVTDASDDDNGNDGSTNLEASVELDMGYLPYGTCSPKNQIYAAGLGVIDIESVYTGQLADGTAFSPTGEECSYQVINLGYETGFYQSHPDYPTQGKLLAPTDVIRLDVLVDKGTEQTITPGTYSVTTSRYPAQMKPGVCVRGFTGTDGNDGTMYQQVVEAIGAGWPKGLDESKKVGPMPTNGPINIASTGLFACIYYGTVTISDAGLNEGGEQLFTFEINGEDVLNHKITGSWTGPVYLNGDTSAPVQVNNSATASLATAKKNTSVNRETAIAMKNMVYPAKRLSF